MTIQLPFFPSHVAVGLVIVILFGIISSNRSTAAAAVTARRRSAFITRTAAASPKRTHSGRSATRQQQQQRENSICSCSRRRISSSSCSSPSTTALHACTISRLLQRSSTLQESPVCSSSSSSSSFIAEQQINNADSDAVVDRRFRELCDSAGIILPPLHGNSDNDAGDDEAARTSTSSIRLKTDPETGVRGLYLNRPTPIKAGDVVLSLPLSACLRDDQPPSWWRMQEREQQQQQIEGEDAPYGTVPSSSNWATRLAASLLDIQLERPIFGVDIAMDRWLSLLPNPNYLRASLPVHWSTPILESACCTALELAVDTSYFTRAEALQDLCDALLHYHDVGKFLHDDERQRLCSNALDLVQTRSCRATAVAAAKLESDELEEEEVSGMMWRSHIPLRIMAPVFDFINHPGCNSAKNAEFALEGDRLVVRAVKNINPDDQIYISYGDSAKPAWKCCSSYGFVPTFDPSEDDDDDDDDDNGVHQHVAEVYLDGVRYEVGPTTIPEDMVLAAAAQSSGGHDDNGEQQQKAQLTPDIAIKLSRRLSDVAYQLLLDPIDRYYSNYDSYSGNGNNDDGNGSSSNSEETITTSTFASSSSAVVETPEDVLSAQVAASLRWNQHRILLTCSMGLREWAVDPANN